MWQEFSIRYAGVTYRAGLGELGLSEQPTDAEIKAAVGCWLSRQRSEPVDVSDFVAELPENERLSGMHADKSLLILRSQAVYV